MVLVACLLTVRAAALCRPNCWTTMPKRAAVFGSETLSSGSAAWGALGSEDLTDGKPLREAELTWSHVHAARAAIGRGFVDTTRAAYHLQCVREQLAVFFTNVCLRLSVLGGNSDNSIGARSAFRLAAQATRPTIASSSDEDGADRRNLAATPRCSWGYREYRHGRENTMQRSVGFFSHAARFDASKAGVTGRRSSRAATQLRAAAIDAEADGSLELLSAAAVGDELNVHDKAGRLEARADHATLPRSPQLLGTWQVAYAPSACCRCACAAKAEALPSVNRVALLGPAGPNNAQLPENVPFDCKIDDERAGTFHLVFDNVLNITNAGPPFDGPAIYTYLDDRVMILRRARCGRPLIVLERLG